MVIVLCILATIGMLVTAFTVDERKYSGGKTSDHGLFSSLKSVFSNRSFVIYLFGFMFFFIGFNGLRASMNYYVEDIMGAGKVGITIASGILFGTSALFFAPVNIASRKYGYKKLMVISLLMLVAVSCCLYGLGKVFPLWTGYLFFALAGIPIAGAHSFFLRPCSAK
jgi:GPH family glycoside/pentoside/hexuronide:cation symporter